MSAVEARLQLDGNQHVDHALTECRRIARGVAQVDDKCADERVGAGRS